MPKRFLFVAVTAISLCAALPAAAQDETAPNLDTVLATVNGVDITLGHVAVARATLPDQYQQLPPEVLFPGILDQLISQTALVQSFQGDHPSRVKFALANEERSLIAGEVVESIMQSAVSESALMAAYTARYSDESTGEEYNAAHILVETEEAALAIKAELEGGADFADTAREKSTGPSGPGGGSLGWFGTGQMVPTFEAAVIALRAGQISDPVQTQFGWHVIKLNETRQKEAPALEDVRADLEGQIRNDAVQARIEELTAAATVDRSGADAFDPNLLNMIDLAN